jgi:hypothetical protein
MAGAALRRASEEAKPVVLRGKRWWRGKIAVGVEVPVGVKIVDDAGEQGCHKDDGLSMDRVFVVKIFEDLVHFFLFQGAFLAGEFFRWHMPGTNRFFEPGVDFGKGVEPGTEGGGILSGLDEFFEEVVRAIGIVGYFHIFWILNRGGAEARRNFKFEIGDFKKRIVPAPLRGATYGLRLPGVLPPANIPQPSRLLCDD